jgi:RNA polymerase sigma factor (TIGR02999 family)
MSGVGDITQLLQAWGEGDRAALQQLTPLVYAELHRLAKRCMVSERADHTLQPTSLVHEAYLRLIDSKGVACRNRTHFFALSARLMRRILVDLARSRRNQKRGGGRVAAALDEAAAQPQNQEAYMLALDEALDRLAEVDSRKSEVVELRFFGGLNIEETAEVLKVSRDTVMRDWKVARLWLLRELEAVQTNAT